MDKMTTEQLEKAVKAYPSGYTITRNKDTGELLTVHHLSSGVLWVKGEKGWGLET